MLSYKESLKILKKTDAILEGHFILSSGLHSGCYVQCAKLLSFPKEASKICTSLSKKIIKAFPSANLILSPAIGGIIIGYEIGRLLNIETIFSERVSGRFELRRGFSIRKSSRVIILEDVITTGKSSLECVKLIKESNAKLLGFACIIDRTSKNKLKIRRNKIISQIRINIPTYKNHNLPSYLKKLPIQAPGSRFQKSK